MTPSILFRNLVAFEAAFRWKSTIINTITETKQCSYYALVYYGENEGERRSASLTHHKSEEYTSGQVCLHKSLQRTQPFFIMFSDEETAWLQACRKGSRWSIQLSVWEKVPWSYKVKKKKKDRQTDKEVQPHALWVNTHDWLFGWNKQPPFKRRAQGPKWSKPFPEDHTSGSGSLATICSPGNQPHWQNQIPHAGPQLRFLKDNWTFNGIDKRRYLSEIASLCLISHCAFFSLQLSAILGTLNNV